MQAILKAHIYAFFACFCHLSLLGCLLSQEKQKNIVGNDKDF